MILGETEHKFIVCNEIFLSQRRTRIGFIDLYIVFYIFIAMSGSLSQTYLYVVMGLLVGLLLLFIFNIRIGNLKINNSYYLILFYLLYIFIVGLPVAGLFFTAKQVGVALIQFSSLVIYYYYTTKSNLKSKQFILKCLYLILLYYLISSYFAYTRLDVNARRIADHTADYGDLSIGGGYSFAYAIALFAVYLFDRLRNRSILNYKELLLYLLLVFLSTIVIFETKSTITFIAYSVGLLLTLLSPISKYHKKQNLLFYTKVLLLIIIMVISLFLLKDVIGRFVVSIGININNILGDRIQSLGYLLLNSDAGLYASGRIAIPLNSFKTFLRYPIFGIARLHGNGFYKPSLFGAGNHCEWVDALTNWGLIGGLPFLYLYFSAIGRIYKNSGRALGSGLWATFIILGLFNPFRSIQTAMIVFLVLPLHSDLHNQRENRERK